MWSRKSRLTPAAKAPRIQIVMPATAMTTVFDECDHFTEDETGGRVIGTYRDDDNGLTITVGGIIEPGPSARRSRVSFFQDGAYQEGIFRKVEERHPEIEHLGNWHTHHVNGLPHLSGGDIETYTRIVNHQNHNIDFFYALLVTAKNTRGKALKRYDVKHYVFRRGAETFEEVPAENVIFSDDSLVWPASADEAEAVPAAEPVPASAWPGRIADREVLAELFSSFKSYNSDKLGFYWRGKLELVDGSTPDLVVLEDVGRGETAYSVMLPDPPEPLKDLVGELGEADYPSARAALATTERALNRVLFERAGPPRK